MNFMKNILIVGMMVFAMNLQAQDARVIADKAMVVMEVGSMEMEATLQIVDAKGRERVRKIITQTKPFGDVTKTLLKFTAPPDVKGTGLLIYDYDEKSDDMWIYLPALRKTRRIVSNEKGKSFMGSEFTNADMSIPNPDDFVYKILGEESLNGKDCWKIESACKDEDIEDENGYSRKLSWIDKENFLCYKIEFYDFDNELHKVQSISEFKPQKNEKYFAFLMEMKNVRNKRTSIMTVNSFTLDSNLTEQSFSPVMLDK